MASEHPRRKRTRPFLVVLSFHRVAMRNSRVVGLPPVPPERFRRYLRWIARSGRAPIGPREWLSSIRTGRLEPKHPVLITFDDADAEIAQSALPALAEMRFPAVVFVPTDAVGGSNKWDRVHGFTQMPIMDEKAIALWSRRGIVFGSHGASHVDMTSLPRDALVAQLERSARRLREITGETPVAISYPYGSVNDQVRTEAGRIFPLGFTMRSGLNGLSGDPMTLRRVEAPSAASWLRFRFILAFGVDPVFYVRDTVRPRLWLRKLATRMGLDSAAGK